MKIQSCKQTGLFLFCFVFSWDLEVEEHATYENSTLAGFKLGCTCVKDFQIVVYMVMWFHSIALPVYLYPSAQSKCYTRAHTPLISPVWQLGNYLLSFPVCFSVCFTQVKKIYCNIIMVYDIINPEDKCNLLGHWIIIPYVTKGQKLPYLPV